MDTYQARVTSAAEQATTPVVLPLNRVVNLRQAGPRRLQVATLAWDYDPTWNPQPGDQVRLYETSLDLVLHEGPVTDNIAIINVGPQPPDPIPPNYLPDVNVVARLVRGATLAQPSAPVTAQLASAANPAEVFGGAAVFTRFNLGFEVQLALSGLQGSTVTVDWGDGSPVENPPGGNTPLESDGTLTYRALVIAHTYVTGGTFTITATDPATNRVATWQVDTAARTITPETALSVAGELPAPENLQVTEVRPTSMTVSWQPVPGAVDYVGTGTAIDPATPGDITFTTTDTTGQLTGAAPETLYRVTVQARDTNQTPGQPAEVDVVPPQARIPQLSWTAERADYKTGTLTIWNLDDNAVINWGDGTTATPITPDAENRATATHTYAADGTYTISVDVTGTTADGTTEVTIELVVIPMTAAAQPGVLYQVRLEIFDNPNLEVTLDWGDGTPAQDITLSATSPHVATHTYTAGGKYTVTCVDRADANRRGETIAMVYDPLFTLTATRTQNTAPGAVDFTASPGAGQDPLGGPVSLTLGDGNTVQMSLQGNGTFTYRHLYTNSGTYVAVAENAANGMLGMAEVNVVYLKPVVQWEPDAFDPSGRSGNVVITDLWVQADLDFDDPAHPMAVVTPGPNGTARVFHTYTDARVKKLTLTGPPGSFTVEGWAQMTSQPQFTEMIWRPAPLVGPYAIEIQTIGQNMRPSIDWGDSSQIDWGPYPGEWMSHNYATAGNYTLKAQHAVAGGGTLTYPIVTSASYPRASWQGVREVGRENEIRIDLSAAAVFDPAYPSYQIDWGDGTAPVPVDVTTQTVWPYIYQNAGSYRVFITHTATHRVTTMLVHTAQEESLSFKWAATLLPPSAEPNKAYSTFSVKAPAGSSEVKILLEGYGAYPMPVDAQGEGNGERYWADTSIGWAKIVAVEVDAVGGFQHIARGWGAVDRTAGGEFFG